LLAGLRLSFDFDAFAHMRLFLTTEVAETPEKTRKYF